MMEERIRPSSLIQSPPGVVCLKCYRPVLASLLTPKPDRYGRKLRHYLGFCVDCQIGCEVEQYQSVTGDEVWYLVRHRFWVYGGAGEMVFDREWAVDADMPEPAPVCVGTGGDYDRQIYLTVQRTEKLLTQVRHIMSQINTAGSEFKRVVNGR